MKDKIFTSRPDNNRYYSVRASNNLTDLKKWKKWAEKNYPKQKYILVDKLPIIKKEQPQDLDYFKMRWKSNYDYRYEVWATF